jgi:tRNA-specific 2-thiouridylase
VSDVEDARRVAAQLGVPHYVFNFADDFTRDVVDPYVAGYASGTTPNPCVECNRSIKFGRLLERATALGFDAVATGHHARIERTGARYRLLRGADRAKDQSYVLFMLGRAELSRTLLPVGELTKQQVRERAHGLGLRTAAKRESMDVCFITKGGRSEFVRSRAPVAAGAIVAVDGTELGRHDGVSGFTVGQRRGVGVALGARRYVVDVDAATATITLGTRDDLARDEVVLRDLCFADGRPSPRARLGAQTRAHGEPVGATLDGATVRFAVPHARVAPGQVVALYDGDALVGGGIAT